MSFVARNHPQQVATRGPLDDVDDRRTPPDLLAECMTLAGVDAFDLDVAANDNNAVAPKWYTMADDGLVQRWSGAVWCNPPYSNLAPWVAKAIEQSYRCDIIAMLLPANRTEQAWWQAGIEPGRRDGTLRVFFLRGRRRFDRPGWTAPTKGDRPPFGLCLVVWGRPMMTGLWPLPHGGRTVDPGGCWGAAAYPPPPLRLDGLPLESLDGPSQPPRPPRANPQATASEVTP